MGKISRFVIGCGYLGQRVAEAWLQQGEGVAVTTRSPARAREFSERGFAPWLLDVTRPDTWGDLPAVETVLYAVGFDRTATASRHEVYEQGLQNVLERLPSSVARLLYISSTGVFGGADDAWVDERSECAPQREGGRACWAAEQWLRASPWASKSIILRLAGLYGPGRIPYLSQLRADEALPVQSSGYLNLIHVEDAVQVVLAAAHCDPPELLLVADGTPVIRGEYYAEVARCLGVMVRWAPVDTSSPQAQRATSSKRISTARLRQRLPIELRYPTYRDGIRASLSPPADGAPAVP